MISWSLAAFGVIWGLATFWVFRRFTDRAALRVERKRLYAHLLEIRMYSDEPSLVWRAQKALIVDNMQILALLARPIVIMALPFALLYTQLDSIYGETPVPLGRSAVVTMQLSRPLGADDTRYVLAAPAGLVVETQPVRDFADRQISWRIRAKSPVRGMLRLGLPGSVDGAVTRTIASGDRTLSPNRVRESAPGQVWIEVNYPRAPVTMAGVALPWLVWFLILSTATAALRIVWPGAKARHDFSSFQRITDMATAPEA